MSASNINQTATEVKEKNIPDVLTRLLEPVPIKYRILFIVSAYILIGDVIYTFGFQFVHLNIISRLTERCYCYLPPVIWQIAGSIVMIIYFGGLLYRFNNSNILFKLSACAFIIVQILYILILVAASPENSYGLVFTLALFGEMNQSPYAIAQLILGVLFIGLTMWTPYSLAMKCGAYVKEVMGYVGFFGGLFAFGIAWLFVCHCVVAIATSSTDMLDIGNGTLINTVVPQTDRNALGTLIFVGGLIAGVSLIIIISNLNDLMPHKYKKIKNEEVDTSDIQVVGVDTTTEYDT